MIEYCHLIGEPEKAFEAYQADLKRHPNRFNGLYGAGLAAEKSGNIKEAILYFSMHLSVLILLSE